MWAMIVIDGYAINLLFVLRWSDLLATSQTHESTFKRRSRKSCSGDEPEKDKCPPPHCSVDLTSKADIQKHSNNKINPQSCSDRDCWFSRPWRCVGESRVVHNWIVHSTYLFYFTKMGLARNLAIDFHSLLFKKL